MATRNGSGTLKGFINAGQFPLGIINIAQSKTRLSVDYLNVSVVNPFVGDSGAADPWLGRFLVVEGANLVDTDTILGDAIDGVGAGDNVKLKQGNILLDIAINWQKTGIFSQEWRYGSLRTVRAGTTLQFIVCLPYNKTDVAGSPTGTFYFSLTAYAQKYIGEETLPDHRVVTREETRKDNA